MSPAKFNHIPTHGQMEELCFRGSAEIATISPSRKPKYPVTEKMAPNEPSQPGRYRALDIKMPVAPIMTEAAPTQQARIPRRRAEARLSVSLSSGLGVSGDR